MTTSTKAVSTAGKVTSIATMIVGGFALIAAGGSAAFGAVMPNVSDRLEQVLEDDAEIMSSSEYVLTQSMDDVRSVEINANTTEFDLVFGDVDEATLTVSGKSQRAWSMEADEGVLTVAISDGVGPERTTERTKGCLFGCSLVPHEGESVTLTLPEPDPKLESKGELVSATIDGTAADVNVAGQFRGLDITVTTADLSVDAAAKEFRLGVNVGDATVKLADARRAIARVTTGDLNMTLSGTPPTLTDVGARIGAADITLPKGSYSVEKSGTAGEITDKLDHDDASENVVRVSATAAEVVLH